MLDRDGNRIDRRNPQDIFVPLYNKQIPPGAGQVVHFGLEVPKVITGPIALEAKVNYRKFDRTYLNFVFGTGKGPELPVVVMARDQVELPVDGGGPAANDPSPIQATWQRWNDYGIGLLLEGATKGGQKGELKQAEQVFLKVAELGFADGWVNLARVYQREGRIPDALSALEKAANHEKPAAPWVINWLTGQINVSNGLLDQAIASFESVLATKVPERKLDFSLDYRVIDDLGSALYSRVAVTPACRSTVPSAGSICGRRSTRFAELWRSIPKMSPRTTACARRLAIRPGAAKRPQPARPRMRVQTPAATPSRSIRTSSSSLPAGLPTPKPHRPSAGLGAESSRRMWSDSWPARGRATARGWSRCTTWSRSSVRRGTRKPTPMRKLRCASAGSDPYVAARASQGRRDRRRTRVCPGAEQEPSRQPQRSVDRDPFAAPQGAPGIDEPPMAAVPAPSPEVAKHTSVAAAAATAGENAK